MIKIPFKWEISGEYLVKEIEIDEYVDEILELNPKFPKRKIKDLRKRLKEPIVLRLSDFEERRFPPSQTDGKLRWELPIEAFIKHVLFNLRVYQLTIR